MVILIQNLRLISIFDNNNIQGYVRDKGHFKSAWTN